MQRVCRARSGLNPIILIVAGFVAALTFDWSSRIAWGASDLPQGTADPEDALRLEPVVVSASRIEQRLRDVPANVTVITKEDIRKSAARTVDDLLRQVPGFSLFRRNSTLVSNPPSQGVSLRGIGPSATSRTLVLLDGVPFNDPFGGWVYWSKVPLESIERIEVTRGGGSGVYGNYALGGVINIVTRRPEAGVAQSKLEVGTRDTVDADLLASHVIGPWAASLEGSFFRTDGYKIVREDQRGAIPATRPLMAAWSTGLRWVHPSSLVGVSFMKTVAMAPGSRRIPPRQAMWQLGAALRLRKEAIGNSPCSRTCRPSTTPSAGSSITGTPRP